MIRLALVSAFAFVLAAPASAEPAVYELEIPRVACSATSARARAALQSVEEVKAVRTDPKAHSVTVQFDDAELSVDRIINTLARAGYRVTAHRKLD